MAISLDGVKYLAFRTGNAKVQEQINSKAKFRSAVDTEKLDGVRNINVQAGVLGSAAIVVANATYPTAENVQPTQLIAKPVSTLVHALLPIDAAEMCNTEKDAVNLMKKTFDDAMRSAVVLHERGLIDGYCSAVEASASISGQAATVSVNDIFAFRVGAIYDIYDTAATSKVGSGRIGTITRDGDGTGSVGFTGLVDGSNVALTSGITAGVGIWLQGWLTPAAGSRQVSLADACGSADIYGTTVSGADWSGYERVLSAALADDDVRELIDSVGVRGSEPDLLLTNREVYQDLEELQSAKVHFLGGDVLDPVKKNRLKPFHSGLPVCISDFSPGKQLFALSGDGFKLGIKRDFKTLGNEKSGADVSQTQFSYLIKVLGMFQGIVDHRNSVGRIKNITVNQ